MKNFIKNTLNTFGIIFIIAGGMYTIYTFTQVFMDAQKLEQENNKILLELHDRVEYLEQKLEPLPSH